MKPKKTVCTFYNVIQGMDHVLRKKLKGYTVTIHKHPVSLDNLNSETEILGVFVDSQVTKHILDALPHLKLIVTMSTGFDHIDLISAGKRGILVCNVPSYGENTIAQHTLTLILALGHHLFESVKRVKEGGYGWEGLRGFDLKSKTIGLIGTGHIGMSLIRMLNGFDATIIAYDKTPDKKLEKKHGFTYVTYPALLRRSDIVSLHVPLCAPTHHMINMAEIKKMKKGVYIINTARGGLIDAEALVWGLENGRVAGAGLDVLEYEAYLKNPEKLFEKDTTKEIERITLMNNILVDHPRTIITPHNAFNNEGALNRIMEATAKNVIAHSIGNPINLVRCV